MFFGKFRWPTGLEKWPIWMCWPLVLRPSLLSLFQLLLEFPFPCYLTNFEPSMLSSGLPMLSSGLPMLSSGLLMLSSGLPLPVACGMGEGGEGGRGSFWIGAILSWPGRGYLTSCDSRPRIWLHAKNVTRVLHSATVHACRIFFKEEYPYLLWGWFCNTKWGAYTLYVNAPLWCCVT